MVNHPDSQQLPSRINPRKWADLNFEYESEVATSGMERIRSLVNGIDDGAEVKLQFFRDQENRCCVAGTAAVGVQLTCQRCMQPMPFRLNAEMALAVVFNDDQARSLPKEMDPWIVEQETVSLTDMLEDELILALPVVAMHSPEECEGKSHFESEEIEGLPGEPHPFAALADLKGTKDTD